MTTGLSALESLCEPRVNPPVGQAIRQAFGAAAPMYDDHAILQRDTLPTLMECLTTVINPTGLTTLLDVGTGTGAAAMAVAEVLHELEGPDAMGGIKDQP